MFGTIEMQVSFLLKGFIHCHFSIRLQSHLFLKLFLSLILNLNERIVILLQSLPVFIELFPILI